MGLAETYANYVGNAFGCVGGVLGAVPTGGASLLAAAYGCRSALEQQLDFVDQLGCFREVVLSSTIQGRDTPNSCRFSTPFKLAVNEYYGSPIFTITPDAAANPAAPAAPSPILIPAARREQIANEADANIQMLTTRFSENASIYSQWLQESQQSYALAKYSAIGLSIVAVASIGTAVYFSTRSVRHGY